MLERDEVMELQRHGLEAFVRILARGAEDSQLLTFPGVTAAAAPAAGQRSFVNSIVYRSAEELAAAIDPLAVEYRSRGIEAWTVWTPEDDSAAIEILAAAGHRLDAAPAAMAIELADLPAPELDGLDWDDEATASEVASLNDLAYGWGHVGGFADAFTAVPDPALRLFRARVDGELACVAGTIDRDSDCVLAMVATHPERRGAGLARRLCHAALAAARDRGLRTSTLQATRLGQPVYERLGYRSYGTMEMWERRYRSRGGNHVSPASPLLRPDS